MESNKLVNLTNYKYNKFTGPNKKEPHIANSPLSQVFFSFFLRSSETAQPCWKQAHSPLPAVHRWRYFVPRSLQGAE